MGSTGTMVVAIFGIITIGLFALFCYLMSTVNPEIRPRPMYRGPNILQHYLSSVLPDLLDKIPFPEEMLTEPALREDIILKKPKGNRRSNLVRIVDKNFNVLKATKKSNVVTKLETTTNPVESSTLLTNITTTNSTALPVKGVRRSATKELERTPRVLVLKLLPNNTFIFEEDYEISRK